MKHVNRSRLVGAIGTIFVLVLAGTPPLLAQSTTEFT